MYLFLVDILLSGRYAVEDPRAWLIQHDICLVGNGHTYRESGCGSILDYGYQNQPSRISVRIFMCTRRLKNIDLHNDIEKYWFSAHDSLGDIDATDHLNEMLLGSRSCTHKDRHRGKIEDHFHNLRRYGGAIVELQASSRIFIYTSWSIISLGHDPYPMGRKPCQLILLENFISAQQREHLRKAIIYNHYQSACPMHRITNLWLFVKKTMMAYIKRVQTKSEQQTLE